MSPTYPIKGLDIMPMSKNASFKLQSISVDFGTRSIASSSDLSMLWMVHISVTPAHPS